MINVDQNGNKKLQVKTEIQYNKTYQMQDK